MSPATADRKPDKLPTTIDRAPVATVAPGPLPVRTEEGEGDQSIVEEGRSTEVGVTAEGNSMDVDSRA